MVRHGHSASGEQIKMPVAAQAVAVAASSREITHAEAAIIVQHRYLQCNTNNMPQAIRSLVLTSVQYWEKI